MNCSTAILIALIPSACSSLGFSEEASSCSAAYGQIFHMYQLTVYTGQIFTYNTSSHLCNQITGYPNAMNAQEMAPNEFEQGTVTIE
jgi:hypothetical protein